MTYHIFVSGRVQGVGYRRFAQKQANNLQIKGWTRNLADGRVEIYVQGSEHVLEQYCEILRKGPQFSLVHEVIVKSVPEESIQDFSNVNSVEEFKIFPDLEWK